MIALTLFIKNIFGWIVGHPRIVAGAAAVLVLVIGFGLIYRACNKPPSLDQKEIIEAQQAIEKNDRKVMVEILTNSDVREQAIDSNIKQAEEATEKAKQNYSGKTNQEIAAELERRLQEQ